MVRLSLLAGVSLCALTLLAADAGAADPQAAVVVLLDGSTSMNGPPSAAGTPFEQAVAGASLFVAGCDDGIAPGIATFDSSVHVLTPRLEPATPARRRELLAALRQARADGNTDILGAVVAALDLLDGSTAPARWVVLLSDGEQTQPIPAGLVGDLPAATTDAAAAAGNILAARARAKGVRILAVGLGQDADRALLEALAVDTGGAYVAVRDPAQLLTTYVDWLRTVGGYQVARGEQVQAAEGDTDLKVLMALPRARVTALEHGGRPVQPEAAGFDPWSDGRRLHVWQAARPAPGTYRLRFNPDRGPDDHLVFLKRSPQRWDVRLKYLPANPGEPLRVEVRGTPAPAAGQALDATLLVTDPDGKETEKPLTLRPTPDGSLAGEITPDGAHAGQASSHNVRVRLRDSSGWETQHVQTVRFEAVAPLDLHVHVHDPGDLALTRGGKATLAWELRLDSPPAKAGEVAAELAWAPASPSAPRLRLDGAGNGKALRVHLAETTRIPLVLEVPPGADIGPYEARLVLRVVGDRAVTLNGSPTLSLPINFRVEPALVRLRLLDAAGRPLPGNVCTHRVLSPVAPRVDELHFHLVGDVDPGDWQVRLGRAEADGVRCELERRRDGGDRLVVRLNVPAQAGPGVRSFPFDVEPGPDVRLTDDSRQFRIDLDIPEATVALTGPGGGPLTVRHRLGYLDWLGLAALGRPVAWQERVALTGKASGLDDGVTWDVTAITPGPGALGSADAEGGRSWTATLADKCSRTGPCPVRAAMDCPYRPTRVVDAAGNTLPQEDGRAVVGKVEVLPPSLWPPVLLALLGAGLFVLDRLWRRRVPGVLLVAGAAEAALGGQRRRVRLGSKRQRVVLGGQALDLRCRWGTVQARWAGGPGDDAAVSIVCPEGHERVLTRGGAWEPICNDDVAQAGGDEAKYLAPVPRHCLATPVPANDPLF
jgi:hypothetical protein